MPPRFIHLHLHTSHSLLEGAISSKKLEELCKKNEMPAVAITDTGNMFGALEISEILSKSGIQPIIGCQLDVRIDLEGIKIPATPIVLLAKDDKGYRNLIKLSSINFTECGHESPHISAINLMEYSEGLICLSGGCAGPVGQAILTQKIGNDQILVDWFYSIFGNRFYIEIQRHQDTQGKNTLEERETEPRFLKLAYENDIPLVATNDVYFPEKEMFEAHDALICIASGSYVDQKTDRRKLTQEHYFKSEDEMLQLFLDLPEAIENTVEIARRCSVKAEILDPILPKFAENEIEELTKQAKQGLSKRLKVIPHATTEVEYQKRLEFELKVIERMGFPGYFLIVADFIQWAKSNKIPVGPGRGSGAGSLVAYALTITDLDPIKYSLLFERFLNPERVSMPDFDIDFCMDRREEVINYVQEKYGKERVAQIITFGALLSKAAIRDIGRVLQIPYGQVDKLSKLIPIDGTRPVTIDEALKAEPRLLEESKNSEIIARMLNYAGKVEGLLRNAATHAAGVVIADRPLDELVPLYRDPRSEMPATQFNMKWVEQAGLVKFDFLGLKTLTIVKNATDILKSRKINIDINNIPLDDKKTFSLYSSASTVAVFQVESSGMRDALRQLKPTCIEDIIALVALYRPGPMENIPMFCAVKNGQKVRENIHPLIDSILDETQGIIVYQEQVMEIARKMANYSLGGADLLRRAMGKKIKAAMDAEKPKFLLGAEKNKVSKRTAIKVWDLLEKFANYGFNKSHAAAYAVLSYQTAWLKANYPVEFMAAVMNCDIHLTEKLTLYKQEIEALDIGLVPPCINKSRAYFSVKSGEIIYALGALKNVGVNAMNTVVEIRQQKGEFKDLFDLSRKVDLRKLGKRPLETLIRAGALDSLENNRKVTLEALDKLVAYSSLVFRDRLSTQSNLFGDENGAVQTPILNRVEDWSSAKRLREEHFAIGFYLSGHPLDNYLVPLKEAGVSLFSEIKDKNFSKTEMVSMAGIVTSKQERQSSRGNRFAFVQFSEPNDIFEVMVFSDVLEKYEGLLEPGNILFIVCEIKRETEQVKLRLKIVKPVESFLSNLKPEGFVIYIDKEVAVASLAERLETNIGTQDIEKVSVNLVVIDKTLPGDVEIILPKSYAISREMVGAIKHIEGVVHVESTKIT